MAKTKKKTKGWYSHPTKGWVWYDPKTPKKTYHPVAGPTGEVARGAGELAYRLSPLGELKILGQGLVGTARGALNIGKAGMRKAVEGQIAVEQARELERESYRAIGDSISRGVQEQIGDRIGRDWNTGLSVREQKIKDRENRKKRRSLNIGGN